MNSKDIFDPCGKIFDLGERKGGKYQSGRMLWYYFKFSPTLS